MSTATRAVRPTKRFSLRDAHPPPPVRVCPGSGHIPVAVAYRTQAAPALVASPRLALALPLLSTSSAPPLHRGHLRAGALLHRTSVLVNLRARSSGACRHSTGRAREQTSTQHAHGPLASVGRGRRQRTMTPRSEPFYRRRGTPTSRHGEEGDEEGAGTEEGGGRGEAGMR
ncbi:hypothetical protein B0H14DRAFT_3426436 [Mycena olivaceomarginata]|nr:hypothetical protein B0H14DRAFT_3426436 [Mycena olivaceomarginata]